MAGRHQVTTISKQYNVQTVCAGECCIEIDLNLNLSVNVSSQNVRVSYSHKKAARARQTVISARNYSDKRLNKQSGMCNIPQEPACFVANVEL